MSNNATFLSLDNIEDNTRRGIRQGFFRLGRALEIELRKELLAKNKRGIVYKNIRTRTGRVKRSHRSSARGQTPANLSGNYRKNVGYQIRASDSMEFGVRDGAPYAQFLEPKDKLFRPGVGNTVKALEKEAQNIFDSSLRNNLN